MISDEDDDEPLPSQNDTTAIETTAIAKTPYEHHGFVDVKTWDDSLVKKAETEWHLNNLHPSIPTFGIKKKTSSATWESMPITTRTHRFI